MKNKKIIYFILCLTLILWIAPIIYAISTSFKFEIEAISWPIKLIPKKFTVETYKEIFEDPGMPVITWFLNSVVIALLHAVMAVLISALAGYSFARIEFKFKNNIFGALMATMMIPSIMNLVPLYLIVKSLGLVDTIWSMVLPALSGVFNVFLMRQFFMGLPKELEGSAYIDGANIFTTFFKIILPLVKPAVIVVAIFSFIFSWNDYLWPSLVANDVYKKTLPLGMAMMKGYAGKFNLYMALVMVSFFPIVLIFSFTQKYITNGLSSSSGIKG